MFKRRYQFDEAKTQRYLAAGRGTGEGAGYKPWLEISDVPSLGRSHRPYGIKTHRVHHLLSDGEWKAFLKFERSPDVIDIREAFPLDRLRCFQIAKQLGYKPALTTDGTPYVLTIDFLLTTVRDGRRALGGYSFKYDRAKMSERDWQLHRIAEECLRQSEVPFALIDQTIFNRDFEKAYDSVRACYDLTGLVGFDPQVVHVVGSAVLREIDSGSDASFLDVSRSIAASTQTSADTAFRIIKHLIARGLLAVDLSKQRDLTQIRVSDVTISPATRLP